MKKLLLPVLLAFGVTLAVIIGQRMSTDAMAVVIGVAVGVAASVPTSVLLVALLRRERATWRAEQQPSQPALPAPQPPNVIVLDPSQLWGHRSRPPTCRCPRPITVRTPGCAGCGSSGPMTSGLLMNGDEEEIAKWERQNRYRCCYGRTASIRRRFVCQGAPCACWVWRAFGRAERSGDIACSRWRDAMKSDCARRRAIGTCDAARVGWRGHGCTCGERPVTPCLPGADGRTRGPRRGRPSSWRSRKEDRVLVGLLWFDNDPGRPLASKVADAARRYQEKFGVAPNTCYINHNALAAAETSLLCQEVALQVLPATNVLAHHFWVGIEEDRQETGAV